ncbi:hypothetical protein SDC9_141347 [bioreactor metagenome]|uniref:Uncharacterized protein n=1 Tax=bioreactor metagenome TaxID=1076179 RepID=A0A645E0T7_9ZZZZ
MLIKLMLYVSTPQKILSVIFAIDRNFGLNVYNNPVTFSERKPDNESFADIVNVY